MSGAVEFSQVTGAADTILIIAAGPSLSDFDLGMLRGRGFVISVNDAWMYAPWSDCWVTVDTRDLAARLPKPRYHGLRYVAAPEDFGCPAARYFSDREAPKDGRLRYLHRTEHLGLAEDPGSMAGGNSGFGALNAAFHMRPRKIVLFGIDAARPKHYFYGAREWRSHRPDHMAQHMIALFQAAAPRLKDAGIEVLNASAESAIDCFPRMSPRQAVREWLG